MAARRRIRLPWWPSAHDEIQNAKFKMQNWLAAAFHFEF
jgi:hypothetical protein